MSNVNTTNPLIRHDTLSAYLTSFERAYTSRSKALQARFDLAVQKQLEARTAMLKLRATDGDPSTLEAEEAVQQQEIDSTLQQAQELEAGLGREIFTLRAELAQLELQLQLRLWESRMGYTNNPFPRSS